MHDAGFICRNNSHDDANDDDIRGMRIKFFVCCEFLAADQY